MESQDRNMPFIILYNHRKQNSLQLKVRKASELKPQVLKTPTKQIRKRTSAMSETTTVQQKKDKENSTELELENRLTVTTPRRQEQRNIVQQEPPRPRKAPENQLEHGIPYQIREQDLDADSPFALGKLAHRTDVPERSDQAEWLYYGEFMTN